MLPGDLAVVTVTGTLTDPAGSPLTGTVTFTPTSEQTDLAGRIVVPATARTYPLSAQGTFTAAGLAATDNTGLRPGVWAYEVTVEPDRAPGFTFACLLPQAVTPVDLSALIGEG